MSYVYMTNKETDEQRSSFGTYKYDKDGETVKMSNFVAGVAEQVTYVDGRESRTTFRVEGETAQGPLKPAEITADKFAGLGWILDAWGVEAVVLPGNAIKDSLRAAIQTRTTPNKRTVYLATGWQMIDNVPHYLHAGGAINATGNNPAIELQLPHELQRYNLTTKLDTAEGFAASLQLAQITKDDPLNNDIGWFLLALTYAPTIGPVDFGAHVTGRTGTFKSELCSLFQSHYGPMDARSLPGSWSSTGNALEALAYIARNALFVIDDYVPVGSNWKQKELARTADQIVRAQGNQAGRARLTDTSAMQETKYPRGTILSTGEDTPEGHSLRGRLGIAELSPGSIKPDALSRAQLNRPLYVAAMAGWLKWLATHKKDVATALAAMPKDRDALIEIGHSRTPSMLARLIATMRLMVQYAVDIGVINKRDQGKYWSQAETAIISVGRKQAQYLEDADPVEAFMQAIRTILSNGMGHVKTQDGSIPKQATMLGWQPQGGDASGIPTYKAMGKKIGWINWENDELYLDIQNVYGDLKRASQNSINLSQTTMLKRLKEAGYISRIDAARNRNIMRVTAEGHARNVIVLTLTTTLETSEIPQ